MIFQNLQRVHCKPNHGFDSTEYSEHLQVSGQISLTDFRIVKIGCCLREGEIIGESEKGCSNKCFICIIVLNSSFFYYPHFKEKSYCNR